MLLLHLSDFHFGPKSRFDALKPEELGVRLADDLRQLLPKLALGAGIDVVVVTGDLAETGTRPQFAQARTFLAALATELGLPRLRFVLLPGNHDVSWAACRRVEEDQEEFGFEDAERERRIHAGKLAGFAELLKDFYAPLLLENLARPLEGGGWLYCFEPLGLSVAALNSCEKETHRPADRVGQVSKKQAQSLLDAWRDPALVNYFKVIALHHPPVGVTKANADLWMEGAQKKGIDAKLIERFVADLRGIEGSEELKVLAKNTGAQLVLHGHQHAGDANHWADGRCHVLSAGSLCLVSGELPADEPLSFRLVELAPGVDEAKVWSFLYSPRALVPGRVEKGAFRLDDAEPQPRELTIRAPRAAAKPATAAGKLSAEQEAFLRIYREAFKPDFDRWELSTSGVASASGFRKVPAALDDMYLPLRLAAGWDPKKLDLGRVLGPAEILAREKPLLIRGQAGSGKSTWVKYTFRRLVRDEGAFPLLLVLRDLALSWKRNLEGGQRSLPAYLKNKIDERLAGLFPADRLKLRHLLAAEHGPRPILLVDGWDEIGPVGEEVRTKLLALMNLHSRVLVIVTSRPYDAGGRPSHTEGFEELDVQPLSNEEVRHFSGRFFGHLHGADQNRSGKEVAGFKQALERTAEARELARTPLLLTMMLGIHSVEPLPDKRHRLYEACIRNLLANLPERKAEEGARTGHDQWFPPDSEERLQVVARLAFELQSGGYELWERSAIVARRLVLTKYLPRTGQWCTRGEQFLNWLVATAGLLSDRADDSLAFSHLSFQEYLAAFHLKATATGEGQLLQLAERPIWWETLVLWAALERGESSSRAAKMIDTLLSSEKSLPHLLAGLMLADGLGTSELLSRWVAMLASLMIRNGKSGGLEDRVAQAFATSRQKESLRAELLRAIDVAAQGAGWFLWERLADFAAEVDPSWPLREPAALMAHALVSQLAAKAQKPAFGAAAARCLAGVHPLWPMEPAEWALLQLWPARRRVAGARLELLAAADVEASLLRTLSVEFLREPEEQGSLLRDFARDLTRDLVREEARSLVRDLPGDFGRSSARDLARSLTNNWVCGSVRAWGNNLVCGSARDVAREWAIDLARNLTRDMARDLARKWARGQSRTWVRTQSRNWARERARDLGIAETPRLLDLLSFELRAFGRVGARALLSAAGSLPDDPRWRLLQQACRLSLNPRSSPTAFDQTLEIEGPNCGDPLWPALARHMARRALPGDRALLEDALRHPESRPEPLRSGLQFIARGDVIFNDGTVKTLDQLCLELGLPLLPLLEDLPDEIDLGPD